MKKFHFILITALCWLTAACTTPPGRDLGNVLEKEIPRLMELAEVPGLSIAVIREGRILWSGAFGVRSTETGEPVDENTMFEAASLTKTITAACALKLVERGELDLDTPLCEYLPYPKLAGDERYKKITARLVLTHTTGLPNWGTRLIREPGSLYGYSGEGFLYLGLTVEKITGRNLDAFARDILFDPLGMTRTSYVWTEAYAENGACGHGRYGDAHPLRRRDEPNGGASLLTTPNDYARYLCALLNDEALLPATIQGMISPQVQAAVRGKSELDEHISWGWGWGVQPAAQGTGFWHWGNNNDLRGYTAAYKDRKAGFVFFANSENTFALAEPLAALITDEPQWGMGWLHFEDERYDNPERTARRAVEKAFLNQGVEAGQQKLAEIRERRPELFNASELARFGGTLIERGKLEEAAALLTQAAELEPKRARNWEQLGLVEMERERFTEASGAFGKALAINPQRPMAKTGMRWVRELKAAKERPVGVSSQKLQACAGEYGPRRITLRGGVLFYQREGGTEYRLSPLSQDTFYLEGYFRFRLRFTMGRDGRADRLTGLYIEGRSDENERTG